MKKRILKISSIVLAFLLGLIITSYLLTAGNSDLTSEMSEVTLPMVYMNQNGEVCNPLHGNLERMDDSYMRDSVIQLPEDRELVVSIDAYDNDIQSIAYEVRSLDADRLIEDTEVSGFSLNNGYIEAKIQIKDLLDAGEEYELMIQIKTSEQESIYYYTHISNISDNHVKECIEFADMFHEATFDKENTVSMAQYLETDSTADNGSFEKVTIHSKYNQIIWGEMGVKPESKANMTLTEIESDTTGISLNYTVSYTNEDKEKEYYEVEEYYRVRYTEQRMYLLDYNRTANRIFDPELTVFTESQLLLGILDEDVEFKKNEEENIVGFVQSGELWCYDVAQNKISYVFGFRKDSDPRSNFTDHGIKIINIDETGSMDFIVYGYMNRGIHEGMTGIAVYSYDAMTNTTEERVFLESSRPYAVMRENIGELAYVNKAEMLYLYYADTIYSIDLNTRELSTIAEGLQEECYMVSETGKIVAWQNENTLYNEKELKLLNLETGRTESIQADEGEYLQALGFMGTDFIYGAAYESDIQHDLTGNIIFPMHRVSIQDESGAVIREFEYGSQGKYVVAVSIESNRIQLECVSRTEQGTYEETTPEPITSKTVDINEKISLKTRTTEEKKREYIFSFTDKTETADPKLLKPRQVIFEGNRTISAEEITVDAQKYYVYGQGKLDSSFTSEKNAILRAYDIMGVVVDGAQNYIWERGGRKTRTQITGLEAVEMQAGKNSLAASVEAILNYEKVYANVSESMSAGSTAYELLSNNLTGKVIDLSGCSLSMVLYYVSQGAPVLVLQDAQSAVVITGYDAQNILIMDPISGITSKMGMEDSAAMFEATGNIFISYIE